MTKILLIRHGESSHNLGKIFTGQIDAPLSALGERQAEAVCRYISEHYSVDAVCASDLQRAVNTVRPLAEALELPIETYCGLRELDVGLWGGRSHEELAALFPESYRILKTDLPRFRCDGGESYAELFDRSVSAIREIAEKYEGKTVAVGAHGGVIRCILAKWHGNGLKDIMRFPIMPNTGISELICEKGRFHFEKIGLSEHLEQIDEPQNIV